MTTADFYEDDEPVEKLAAAFAIGDKGYTAATTTTVTLTHTSAPTITLTVPLGDLSPRECIEAMWRLAENDECDSVTFDASSDQWWLVTAGCRHGRFSGVSRGPIDVERAFNAVLAAFRAGHPTTNDQE